MKRLLLLMAIGSAFACGCSQTTTCGPGMEPKVGSDGTAQCVPVASGLLCDADAGAKLVGGACVGDPSQFPTCGAGTMLDRASNTCVPLDGGGPAEPCTVPPACTPADRDMSHFCISGVVRYLKDESCTAGRTFEVRLFEDPLAFLGGNTTPDAVVMTDAGGGYKLPMAKAGGLGIVAVATIDPGMSHVYYLTGGGLKNVASGQDYRLDLYAVEAQMVATWDQQAGLTGMNTFEMGGAYLGRFYSALDEKMLVPGVKLTPGTQGTDTFYFKGNVSTLDKTQMQTDATGSAIERVKSLNSFSGTSSGGAPQWEVDPGGSAPGVLFIQKFYPMM